MLSILSYFLLGGWESLSHGQCSNPPPRAGGPTEFQAQHLGHHDMGAMKGQLGRGLSGQDPYSSPRAGGRGPEMQEELEDEPSKGPTQAAHRGAPGVLVTSVKVGRLTGPLTFLPSLAHPTWAPLLSRPLVPALWGLSCSTPTPAWAQPASGFTPGGRMGQTPQTSSCPSQWGGLPG